MLKFVKNYLPIIGIGLIASFPGLASDSSVTYKITDGNLVSSIDTKTPIFIIKDVNDAKNIASALTFSRLKNSQAVTNILNGHSLHDKKDGSYFNTAETKKIAKIVDKVIQNASHYDFNISHSSGKPFLALAYDLSKETIVDYVDSSTSTHIGYDTKSNKDTNQVIVCFGFGNSPKAGDIRVLTAYPSTSLGGCH